MTIRGLHLWNTLLITIAIVTAVVGVPASVSAHGPLQEQIDELTRQIDNQPTNADLFLRRGELHRLEGHASAAEADFEHALELDPERISVHVSVALLHRDQGRPDDALQAVDRCLARRPDHAAALFVRAEILIALDRSIDAVAEMDRAIRLTETPRPEHYMQRAVATAGATADRNNIERALGGLDDGMQRLGPVVSLQLYAIELEERRDCFDRALERLSDLIKQSPRREELLARRGRILESQRLDLEALVAYTESLEAIETLPPGPRHTASIKELETFVRTRLTSLSADTRGEGGQSP